MIDPAHLPGLQMAAKYRTLRRILRSSAIGSFIFGTLALVIGGITLQYTNLNLILIGLGVALIVFGVLDLTMPRSGLLLADGILLLVLAAWNVVVTILNAAGGGRVNFGWIVIFQVLAGIYTIKRYGEFKDTPTVAPPAPILTWLDQTATTIRKTKPANSPFIVEWIGNRGSWNNASRWRAQLVGETATAVDAAGAEVLLVPHQTFTITKGKKAVFGKRVKIVAQLGAISMKGTMEPAQFERFQAWRWAGMNQSPHGLWVPQA